MATSTEAQILTLAQWFSPAFPVGGFHFSHGLEHSISTDQVTDACGLQDWIADVLEHGAGFNDALVLNAAYLEPDEAQLDDINATARAFAPAAERLREGQEMGRAFAAIASELTGQALKARLYPVVVGQAARLADLPRALTTQMYLQAFASNLASVGMRLIPIGHTQGQRCIQALLPLCEATAARAASGDMTQLSSTAFLSDIAAMGHETQSVRIFRT